MVQSKAGTVEEYLEELPGAPPPRAGGRGARRPDGRGGRGDGTGRGGPGGLAISTTPAWMAFADWLMR